MTDEEIALIEKYEFDMDVVVQIRKAAIAAIREAERGSGSGGRPGTGTVIVRRPGRYVRENPKRYCWNAEAINEQIMVLTQLREQNTEASPIIDRWLEILSTPADSDDLEFIAAQEELDRIRKASHQELKIAVPGEDISEGGLQFLFQTIDWTDKKKTLASLAAEHFYTLEEWQTYSIHVSFDDHTSASEYLDKHGFDIRPELTLQPFWWERLKDEDAWRSWTGRETIRKTTEGYFELYWPAQQLLKLQVTRVLLTKEPTANNS